MVWAVRGALEQKTRAWPGCNWEPLQEVCGGNDASGREFCVERIKITGERKSCRQERGSEESAGVCEVIRA